MSWAGDLKIWWVSIEGGKLDGWQGLLNIYLSRCSRSIAWVVVGLFCLELCAWLSYFRSDFGGFFLSSSSFIVFVALYIKARAASAIEDSSALRRRFSSCRFFI